MPLCVNCSGTQNELLQTWKAFSTHNIWNGIALNVEVFTGEDISISGRVFHSRFSDISESGSWERVRADVLHQIKPQPCRYSKLNSGSLYLLGLTWPIFIYSVPVKSDTCIDLRTFLVVYICGQGFGFDMLIRFRSPEAHKIKSSACIFLLQLSMCICTYVYL